MATVPTIAPAVFSAYKTPMVDPVDRADVEDVMNADTAALSNGNVVPIIVVGTARMANEHASLATVSHPNESGAR